MEKSEKPTDKDHVEVRISSDAGAERCRKSGRGLSSLLRFLMFVVCATLVVLAVVWLAGFVFSWYMDDRQVGHRTLDEVRRLSSQVNRLQERQRDHVRPAAMIRVANKAPVNHVRSPPLVLMRGDTGPSPRLVRLAGPPAPAMLDRLLRDPLFLSQMLGHGEQQRFSQQKHTPVRVRFLLREVASDDDLLEKLPKMFDSALEKAAEMVPAIVKDLQADAQRTTAKKTGAGKFGDLTELFQKLGMSRSEEGHEDDFQVNRQMESDIGGMEKDVECFEDNIRTLLSVVVPKLSQDPAFKNILSEIVALKNRVFNEGLALLRKLRQDAPEFGIEFTDGGIQLSGIKDISPQTIGDVFNFVHEVSATMVQLVLTFDRKMMSENPKLWNDLSKNVDQLFKDFLNIDEDVMQELDREITQSRGPFNVFMNALQKVDMMKLANDMLPLMKSMTSLLGGVGNEETGLPPINMIANMLSLLNAPPQQKQPLVEMPPEQRQREQVDEQEVDEQEVDEQEVDEQEVDEQEVDMDSLERTMLAVKEAMDQVAADKDDAAPEAGDIVLENQHASAAKFTIVPTQHQDSESTSDGLVDTNEELATDE